MIFAVEGAMSSRVWSLHASQCEESNFALTGYLDNRILCWSDPVSDSHSISKPRTFSQEILRDDLGSGSGLASNQFSLAAYWARDTINGSIGFL